MLQPSLIMKPVLGCALSKKISLDGAVSHRRDAEDHRPGSRPLSAEEMSQEFADRSFKLPVLGPKIPLPKPDEEPRPPGSPTQLKEAASRVQAMLTPLSDRRISVRSQLSEAIWNPEIAMARLSKPQGKHFETMGHIHGGSLHLHPEEALFLLEANQLLLTTRDQGILSVERAFQSLLCT